MEINNQEIDVEATKKAIKRKFGTLKSFALHMGINGSNLSKRLKPQVSDKFILKLKENNVFVSKNLNYEHRVQNNIIKEAVNDIKETYLSSDDKDRIIKELLLRIEQLSEKIKILSNSK